MRRFASVASGLFACVTACGDDGGARKLPDAPTSDVPIDMVQTGSVNILARSRCCAVAQGSPVENVLVVAILPDRTVAGTAMTNAQGEATLTGIQPGTIVTAVYPEDTNQETGIFTYLAVQPGDTLTFGDGYYDVSTDTGGTLGDLTVTWPAVPNANNYYLYSPCGNGFSTSSTSLTFTLYPYCAPTVAPFTAPMVLVAYDNQGRIISTAYRPAATYEAGSFDFAPADLVAQAPEPSFSVSISGVESSVYEVRLEGAGLYGSLVEIDDWQYAEPKGGSATQLVQVPSTAPVTLGHAEAYRSGNYGEQRYFRRGASPIAFTGGTLPWVEGSPIVSFSQGRILWLATPGTYDAATIHLRWNRDMNKQSHYYVWNLVVPPGVSDLTFGTPPAELAAYLPTADDFVDSDDLQLVDLSSVSDYDAVRALPIWRITEAESSVRAGDEPAAAIADGGEGFSFAH